MATLLILAAGMGSRFGGLKQLESVGPGGETLLDYSIYDAVQAGFKRAVFVIRREFEKDFCGNLGRRYEKLLPVEYAYQELNDLPEGYAVPVGRSKPWGTGHAILVARDKVREPFAMINADDFYGAQAYKVMARHLEGTPPGEHAYSLVAYKLGRTLSDSGSVSRGICRIEGGKLKHVEEYTELKRSGAKVVGCAAAGGLKELELDTPVSMNLWGFTPKLFELLERDFAQFLAKRGAEPKSEFYIPTVVDDAVKAGTAQVTALYSDDPWFGITYRDDIPTVREGLRRLTGAGKYPARLHEVS